MPLSPCDFEDVILESRLKLVKLLDIRHLAGLESRMSKCLQLFYDGQHFEWNNFDLIDAFVAAIQGSLADESGEPWVEPMREVFKEIAVYKLVGE